MVQLRSQILENLVRDGALEALAALQSDSKSDVLMAFALCTDDDVSTLFHVGCTKSFYESCGMADVEFLPTEWIQTGDCQPAALDAANALLQERARGDDVRESWQAIRDQDFSALVRGLAAARLISAVDPNVFLSVISTDPGPHILAAETAGILQLNPLKVVRRWREWRLRDAQAYLLSVETRSEPLSYAEQDLRERLRAEVNAFSELLAEEPA